MLSDSILDLGKCPNRKTHESESACFPVGALPKVQNWIWKHFSHKVLYNYYSKKNCGAFRPLFNKVKKWISHCIFKSCAEGLRFFFFNHEANFLPNGLYLPSKQLWGSPMFGFWHHHLYQALRICLEWSLGAIYFSTHQFELIHPKIIYKQIGSIVY